MFRLAKFLLVAAAIATVVNFGFTAKEAEAQGLRNRAFNAGFNSPLQRNPFGILQPGRRSAFRQGQRVSAAVNARFVARPVVAFRAAPVVAFRSAFTVPSQRFVASPPIIQRFSVPTPVVSRRFISPQVVVPQAFSVPVISPQAVTVPCY